MGFVQGVLIKNPDMDLSYILYWLNELSMASADPFLDCFEDVLRPFSENAGISIDHRLVFHRQALSIMVLYRWVQTAK